MPHYLSKFDQVEMKTTLFGHTYDAPFGIAPIGLQGLIWPNAPEILSKAAVRHNIPFILSTVSTESIERIGELTEGKAWFQLYHPAQEAIKIDLIRRSASVGNEVLVILADVPSFGFRPRNKRNGLSIPLKMNFKNIFEILKHPHWVYKP